MSRVVFKLKTSKPALDLMNWGCGPSVTYLVFSCQNLSSSRGCIVYTFPFLTFITTKEFIITQPFCFISMTLETLTRKGGKPELSELALVLKV